MPGCSHWTHAPHLDHACCKCLSVRLAPTESDVSCKEVLLGVIPVVWQPRESQLGGADQLNHEDDGGLRDHNMCLRVL